MLRMSGVGVGLQALRFGGPRDVVLNAAGWEGTLPFGRPWH